MKFESKTCALSEIVTEVNPVQPLNGSSPMLVTLFGIVIEVKFVHPENAYLPMLVTPSRSVIVFKPTQSINAYGIISPLVRITVRSVDGI